MGRLLIFAAKVRAFFAQSKANREFDEELEEHLQLLRERFVTQGMSQEDADTAARRQFGNTTFVHQQQREARTFLSPSTLWRDLCFGARMMRKNPGSTAAIVIALALGIGMNTCVFTFVNTLLLRPPTDVQAPGELREVFLHNRSASGVESYLPFTYPDYSYFRDHTHSFTGLLAFDGDPETVIWNRSGEGRALQVQVVSGNFFSLLGVNPVVGRTFSSEDDQASNPQPVVVLGHAFWQRTFASDPNIIGKNLLLNGANFTVIGVAPAGFSGILIGMEPDVWAPLTIAGRLFHDPERLKGQGSFWLLVAGRLASNSDSSRALAELRVLAHQVELAHPDTHRDLEAAMFPATLVPAPYRGYVSAFTGLLMAVFGLVLLIACVNAASLLLVRATGRAREMAIRSAMGAARGRIIRQMLVESLLLCSTAGCAGFALAWWFARLLMALKPASLPLTLKLPFDWRVLLFTIFVSLFTGIVFGLVPALRGARVDTVAILKEETQSSGCRNSRLRTILMIGQIAACAVLLIGATLCTRSLLNANSIDTGFDTQHLAVASLDPGSLGYTSEQIEAFYRQLAEKMRALPNVTSASYVNHLPLGPSREQSRAVEGSHADIEQNQVRVDVFRVAPQYFKTMGVTLLRGRDFAQRENKNTANTMIVNETLARRLWPGIDPVGKSIILSGEKTRYEVIGVVKTGKYRTLGEDPIPVIFRDELPTQRILVVRALGDETSLLGAIRREIQIVDPNMVPTDTQTMQEYMSLPLFPARATGLLLGASGILALVLAWIGLFGVISYAVSQRTREIGIRMAMGAHQGNVLKLVMQQGLFVTGIGLAIGLGVSFAATRLLSALLYGIRPNDPLTIFAVSIGLTVVTLLACYIPARRAMRVDPMVALRYE